MSDNKSAPEPSMDEILASIRRILAEDEPMAPPPPVRPRAEADILDLTEAINDDGTVRHIAPISLSPTEAPAPVVSGDRIEPVAPRLVSDAASEAVAASFARLASVRREGGDAMLDELVRDALRPLLQAWLDENLPALVERLVRAEIARVVGARPIAP
jgi:cell pole-organizing protein PopZ